MTSADVVFMLLPGVVIIAVLLGSGLVAEARCRRQNARIQAEYQAARAQALRDGTKPPFPPNELRWGR